MPASPPLVLTRGFRRDQAVLNAYNRRRLGPREVPLAAVAGSVGRPDLCDPAHLAALMATSRYRGILGALNDGHILRGRARGSALPLVSARAGRAGVRGARAPGATPGRPPTR